MACLVVREKNNPDRLYGLRQPKIVIGRDAKAVLVLPNVSVSRRHARLIKVGDDWFVEDLGSQNGTELNGAKLESQARQKLKSGDELFVGKFRLMFFGDSFLGLFKGKTLDELPQYSPFSSRGEADSTYRMSPAMMEQMKASTKVMERARLILDDGKNQTWRPEDKTLTFGGEEGLPVTGMFVKGEVAELSWTGKAHRLRRTAILTKVKVNGTAIEEQDLKSGDRLLLGKTGYVYKVV